jgi:DASS family divalent anion:Na+ symporter
MKKNDLIKLMAALLIGAGILWFPVPQGLDPRGWHLLAIFVPTIFCIITKPFPTGAVAFFALTLCVLTSTLSLEHALEGFGYEVVWLVIFAYFIAKGFLVTSIGQRIAYYFVSVLGGKSLGLSYGLAISDLILAPLIPSVSARAAGIIYPIVQSIARSFGSEAHQPSRLKIGAFLTYTTYQTTAITCAMFMTAMAANPLIAELTRAQGIKLTWIDWALGASLPGLISLLLIPFLIYKIATPELTATPDAPRYAREKLAAMGKMGRNEWLMALTMIMLLGLWIGGEWLGISAVAAAMLGLAVLVVSGVLSWSSLMKEADAWETFVWFSILLVMAKYLGVFGVPQWFSHTVAQSMAGVDWRLGVLVITLVYFYSHYFFASATAHVSSMYVPFLVALLGLGTPPLLVVFLLMYASNLFGGLTHYTLSPGPILFGVGYCDVRTFAKVGFYCSLVNILVWGSIGIWWWKFLGYW